MGKEEDDDLTTGVAAQRPDLVSKALARGADSNAKLGSVLALHIAALNGDSTIVDLLLAAGADVNGRGDCADAPLHFACAGAGPNCERIVRTLIEAGADVNAPGIDGRLPLDMAALKRHKAAVLLLAEAGGRCAAENRSWVEQVGKKRRQSRGRGH